LAIKSRNFNILIFPTIILLLVGSGFINQNLKKPEIVVSKEDSAINIDYKILKIFSFGQSRLFSDFLWITTLLESDTEHYKKRDLSSWMYLRFESIVELDPYFLSAYQFGGKYLNIIKDDLTGSDRIFSKGLQTFPNDYELLFNYGFLLAFEINDAKRAIPIYKKLLLDPKAPKYIKSIIGKLQFENQKDISSTMELLQEMYNKEPDGSFLKPRLQKDIHALKIQIDLACLNSIDNKSCNYKDPYGAFYMKKDHLYIPPNDHIPYKLYRRTDEK
jgi:hypothetical protein